MLTRGVMTLRVALFVVAIGAASACGGARQASPQDALDANQTGSASYLLMIGRDGSVMDCVVNESSGVASLDAMGCQVIRERAKFKPAIDAAGKPTVDTYGTPPIRWMISG